jgi:hypothetical protein
MIRQVIRYLAIAMVLGCIFWYQANPGHEPIITGIASLIAVLGTIRIMPHQEQFSFPPIAQPVRNDTCSGMSEALDLFANRFAAAFPGVRNVEWFSEPQDCINRLSIILASPLEFGRYAPIWWWRGYSNYHITNFRHLGGRKILFDHKELVIDKIAAINLSHPARLFVYVQTKADKPSGVYPNLMKHAKRTKRERGYVYEELGLYGDRYVSREEYDDGVARINGVTVDLKGKVELRSRYLSPYNFVIAPQSSVINRNDFDPKFQEIMNAILRGDSTIEDLAEELNQLPRKER